MTELIITTSQVQGDVSVAVLHLQGHLHGPTEQELIDHANQAQEDGAQYILLDLTELEVISSAGLRAIQIIFKMMTPKEEMESMRKRSSEPYKSPYLKLVCPNPHIYYVLNITGFMQNLLVYNNLDEAIKSFGG
jgi:anti-anti-sigma factor